MSNHYDVEDSCTWQLDSPVMTQPSEPEAQQQRGPGEQL